MTEIFRFFNSAPGDERWHYASDFADYFGSVLSSGLISNKNEPVGLQVTVNSGTLTTNVAIGKAIIKGYSYENTQPITLTHGIPEQTMDRIDRVVLRWNLRNSARFIKVFVKEGVSATTPIPPTLQRDTNVYELSLAKVTIRKNSASIVVSDIVDERANEELCGIVQSLITVPTSVFQQQFTAWFNGVSGDMEQEVSDWQATQQQAFNDWFATIQGALDGDIGANLANQIATHKLDNAKHGVIGTATGTNTLVMTNSDVTAYTDMMLVAFKNTTASTGATTLNINGLGAKAIVKANGNAVTNLKANAIYQVRYNGTSFTLLGEGGEYGTATASDVLAGKTIGTDNGIVAGIATIASLGGMKKAEGTTTSTGSKITFTRSNGGGISQRFISIDFSVFSFIPDYVFFYRDDNRVNGAPNVYIWQRENYYYVSSENFGNHHAGTGAYRIPYENGVVNLAFDGTLVDVASYKWIAIGGTDK